MNKTVSIRKIFHYYLRRESSRNLFWSVYKPTNFGDLIGPYLFRHFTGLEPRLTSPSPLKFETTYVTVGSILRHVSGDNAIVWGSGIISMQDVFMQPHRVCAVRGPLTRKRFIELGYNCPEVYGDPAILLPSVYRPPSTRKPYQLGLVPHFIHYEQALDLFGDNRDIKIVDVTQPIEAVINAICNCQAIASSSLHGLIVAHSYQIPAAWVSLEGKLDGDGTKFKDYLAAGGISNSSEPMLIGQTTSTEEIQSFVYRSLQPELSHLLGPLIRSCPFKSNWFSGKHI
jgi:pyruvyltransferase